ncbi:MAG: chemotaxis protein CheW [Archangium sp.]|nr:chemotaxis protein CheW [Archangium sp.]
MPWLILQLKSQLFALSASHLKELVVAEQITPVARTPPHIRGVVNLRGRVIPVVDLRKRLGMPGAPEEADAFCALMAEREQDHRKWLNELEASVKERRPFTLTTDPHRCAFGRWYDTYRAENVWVAGLLRKFDEPHQRIHRLGDEVEAIKATGQFEAALASIERSREKGLNLMLSLFAELKVLTREAIHETLAVLSIEGAVVAVTLDVALSVEKLSAEELPSGSGARPDGLVRRVGRRSGQSQPVMLLECEHLLDGARVPPGPA